MSYNIMIKSVSILNFHHTAFYVGNTTGNTVW
jgi:hypothetical protein